MRWVYNSEALCDHSDTCDNRVTTFVFADNEGSLSESVVIVAMFCDEHKEDAKGIVDEE